MVSVTTYKILRVIFDLTFVFLFVSIFLGYMHGINKFSGVVLAFFMCLFLGSIMHLVFSHEINKYSNWIKQAKEFPREDIGEVSHISQSSTKVNGKNLSILSVKYKDFEVSFPGCDPDFAFKYRVGDAINIKVHETDDQRFVPAEFSKMK